MAEYIILGGHGKVALQAAQLLSAQGDTVTSVIRNPEQRDDVAATGATALVLDIETAETAELAQAFAGKDAVIFSAGAGGGNPQRTYAVDRDAAIRSMDAAGQAGVERYIMVSYASSRLDHGIPEDSSFFPYAQSKAEADEHLRASSLAYTILGPGLLTLDEPTGKIRLLEAVASGSDQDRETSRGNVALAIVAALRQDATRNKTINFYDGETRIDEAFSRL